MLILCSSTYLQWPVASLVVRLELPSVLVSQFPVYNETTGSDDIVGIVLTNKIPLKKPQETKTGRNVELSFKTVPRDERHLTWGTFYVSFFICQGFSSLIVFGGLSRCLVPTSSMGSWIAGGSSWQKLEVTMMTGISLGVSSGSTSGKHMTVVFRLSFSGGETI